MNKYIFFSYTPCLFINPSRIDWIMTNCLYGQLIRLEVLWTQCSAHFVCLSYQMHSVQFMVLFSNELISESGVINKGDMQNVGGPQDWNLEPVDKRA